MAFQNNQEYVQCYSENISQGGLFLQTNVPPDPNATIEIVLQPPKNAKNHSPITLKGRVVRLVTVIEESKAIHKVAVQFVEMTPQIQTQLDILYEEMSQGATLSL